MDETKINKNVLRLVVISICIIFLTTTANSAFIKTDPVNEDDYDPPIAPLDNYYEWNDPFNNEQNIEISQSWGYVVEGGYAKMKNTYSVWTNPNWEKLVPITVTNNAGQTLSDYAINIDVNYDPDMDSDYEDIRFKHEDAGDSFLSYWIEEYDSNDASVWVKIPTIPTGDSMLYLFYDNPSATSESNFGNVFDDWSEVWANDEQISYHADNEGSWDADVAYGNNQFLVAWEEGPAYWPPYSFGFKQEIRASMYSPSGGDPIVFDKRIYKDDTTYFRNENPSCAYGSGGTFFVAWEHYSPVANPGATTMDIYARTVTKSGSDFTLGSVQHVCTDSNCQADPQVCFNSDNSHFLVVWEDAEDGMTDYKIYGRRYTASGSAVDSDKVLISSGSNPQCEPWAVYDSDDNVYFIVWEEGDEADVGPFRINGKIVNQNLGTVEGPFVVAQPDGWPTSSYDFNFPCVQYNGNSGLFLVTWNDCDISSGDWHGNIYGKIYDSDGSIVVDKFTIKGGSYVRTDIVPYLSDAFFVSYDNNNKVYGRLVSSEGQIYGTDVQLSASASADADWANLATDGSKIFVVWEDLRINYPPPYNDVYPDSFGNMHYLNVPDGSDIVLTWGQEKEMILTAQITSKKIQPANLDFWHQFLVDFTDTVTFDILDSSGNMVLIEDADDGEYLDVINPDLHPAIRIRAHFSRDDPSYTPTIDSWSILYAGIDTEPPVTTVDTIDGDRGIDPWFISECVTIWLKAIDYPEDTGSGIDFTYYTVDGGSPEIYDEGSGIHICSHEPDWYDDWVVNFWSVDKQGNVEDKTKPQNSRTIYIDGRKPECWIYEPTEEAEVWVPFMVKATATDNAGVERVDFDIEPFSQRPNLPWSDFVPPWEWECNEKNMARGIFIFGEENPPLPTTGVNVQVRATAYDASGQYWIHEIFVNIQNWNARSRVFVFNHRPLLEALGIGLVVDKTLKISMEKLSDADEVKFIATSIFTGKQVSKTDNDLSNGGSASLDIPTGFYKITVNTYLEGKQTDSRVVARVLYINL